MLTINKLKKFRILCVLLLSTLTFPLTITGVSFALGGIQSYFHSNLVTTEWVAVGYNSFFAATLVLCGALVDAIGRKRMYIIGIFLFCTANILSMLAMNIIILNFARIIAGTSAAIATTSTMAILSDVYSGKDRVKSFAAIGTALGVGLALGPSIGGELVHMLGWRSVFGLPALITGIVLICTPLIPKDTKKEIEKIDWTGGGLFTIGLLGIIFGFSEGSVLGYFSPIIVGVFFVAIIVFIIFDICEKQSLNPIIHITLLRNKMFSVLALTAGFFMAVMVPLITYLPSYLTSIRNLSANASGLWLMCLTVPTMLFPLIGGIVRKIFSTCSYIVLSVTLTGVGCVILLGFNATNSMLWFVISSILVGSGIGLSNGVIDGFALESLPTEQAGLASGVFNTSRLSMEAISLALVGSIIAFISGGNLHSQSFTKALHVIAILFVILSILIAIVCIKYLREPNKTIDRA